jgi:hypothetical protein
MEDGSVLVPKPSMNAELAGRIEEFLRGGPERLCVVEDRWARAHYPWVAGAMSKWITLGEEMFHVVDASIADRDTIESTLAEAASIDPPSVGILSYGAIGPDARQNTTKRKLEALARRATTIFMSAYDGEAFVLWEGAGEDAQ